MAFACRVLADSVTDFGERLTTYEVTFPRIVLAEVNTHRALSRNSASSRAIPVPKRIAAIEADPFIPEQFGRNRPGMQHSSVLEGEAADEARRAWLSASADATMHAARLAKIDVHKQLANRLLEPFSWHTAIISMTDDENFFNLRVHPAAQGEFQTAARMMRDTRDASVPVHAAGGFWHLPLVYSGNQPIADRDIVWALDQAQSPFTEFLAWVSAARCGRVSYLNHDATNPDPAKDYERGRSFARDGHMSPLEHPARPMTVEERMLFRQYEYRWPNGVVIRSSRPPDNVRGLNLEFIRTTHYCGNFNGWVQLRKLIPGEAVFQGGA